MRPLRLTIVVILLLSAGPFSSHPSNAADAGKQGKASYYHDRFEGRRTGSGEPYDPQDFTAAHRRYPFGTYLLVTNLSNQRTAIVRVNDRGPFKKNRSIDVSRAAAMKLGMLSAGLATVRITPLVTLEKLNLCDSLFAEGQCYDWNGQRTDALSGTTLNVWSSEYCKHAFYMASELALETGYQKVWVRVTGEGKNRRYTVGINLLADTTENERLLERLRMEGFTGAVLTD